MAVHVPADSVCPGNTRTGEHRPTTSLGHPYCLNCRNILDPLPGKPLPPIEGPLPINDMSTEAYYSLDPAKTSARERNVLEHMRVACTDGRGGLAAFEFELETAVPGVTRVSSVSATFTNLKRRRLIRETTIKVRTPTGRSASRHELGDPLAADAPVPIVSKTAASA